MKLSVVFFLFALFFIVSCKIMSNKKYGALINKQDSLFYALDESKVTNVGLKNKNRQLGVDTTNMITKNRKTKIKLDSTRREFVKLEKKLGNLDTTYSTYKNRLTREKKELEEEKKELELERRELYSDLEQKQNRIRIFEDKVQDRKEVMGELRQKIQKIQETFKGVDGLSVKIEGEDIYLMLADKLLFKKGKIIVEKRGFEVLNSISSLLNDYPDILIHIIGHTDSDKVTNIKGIKDNWDLSVLRATSVVRYFVEQGDVDPERIVPVGKAEYDPLVSETSEDTKSTNRRIDIVLKPDLGELYEILKKN